MRIAGGAGLQGAGHRDHGAQPGIASQSHPFSLGAVWYMSVDVLASPFFNANRERFAELAGKYRLPAIYETSEYVRSGCLIAYGPVFTDNARRGATYVDKILKGAKPGDLPVEQPTKFELVINLKAANALGLSIPPSILARADELIE